MSTERRDSDGLVATWSDGVGISAHLSLEVVAAAHRGRPLDSGDPVPGCPCDGCTGLPEDDPARLPAWRRKRSDDDEADAEREWARRVDAARAVTILSAVAWLGLGEGRKRGREHVLRCPFHDDGRPSLRISVGKGLWVCDPCDVGGDAIRLWQLVRRVPFVDAVREMTRASGGWP